MTCPLKLPKTGMKPLLVMLACLGGAMLCASQASAQDGEGNRFSKLRGARAAVVQAEAETPPENDKIIGLNEMYGIWQSFAGDSLGAMATLDQVRNTKGHRVAGDAAEISKYDDAAAENAIKAIVAAARNKRAVLINESHHISMHRAFAQKLARELHKIGFNYLACETFHLEANAQPKYIAEEHGFYTNEPVFAGRLDGRTVSPA